MYDSVSTLKIEIWEIGDGFDSATRDVSCCIETVEERMYTDVEINVSPEIT